MDQVGNLATITLGILTNKTDLMLQSALTSKINIHNYYSAFSKEQEREADLFAIERLNDLKISTKELGKFLKFLEKDSYKKGLSKESFIFAMHPNYEDRLNMIISFSNNDSNKLDNHIHNKFFFIKAKLFSHTQNDIILLENYLSGNALDYGKSIILANQGKLLESLKIINKLIKKMPNNGYFIETKADILLNHGYINQSKKFYEIALSIKNKNIYIKKRLFNIEYDSIEFNNHTLVNKHFKKYKELIFYSSKDRNFFNKWLRIFEFLEKKDWLLYINANIDMINNNNKIAILKLREINKISSDSSLIYNSKKLINQINNE